MQATVEILSGLERKIMVKAPTDHFDQEIEKRLKEMLPKVRLPGFRPGKVPMPVLRKRFGESIHYELIGNLIDKTYHEAITQEKLHPVGRPEIQITKDKPGEPLEYEATIEVLPEIKVKGLENAEIEKFVVDIAQKDVDAMIHKLRRQKAKWSEVDRPAQKGDRVLTSFEGRKDGELFEGGSASRAHIELGSGMAIPGFEEGFMGHKAGDEISITLTFPTDYRVAALAGNPVEFKATIHAVEAPELPALDDEFAKSVGVDEGGIEGLRQGVMENMQDEVKKRSNEHAKTQIINKLLELNPIQIPKTLIDQETHHLVEQERAYIQQMTGNAKQAAAHKPRDGLDETAKRRVHIGLLFGELIDHYKITITPEELKQLLVDFVASHNAPPSAVQELERNERFCRQIEEKALEDKLIETIIAQAKSREKNLSYAEFSGMSFS